VVWRLLLYSAGSRTSRTPVFVSSAASVGTSGEVCPSPGQETLFTRRRGRARHRSSPASPVFRRQVFGENDPSSAASLRSKTRKVRWTAGSGVDGSEDPGEPTSHARPVRGETRVETRQERLGPSTGARPASGSESSATRSSVSTILLLLPVFCLRPALGQVLRDNPGGHYSEGVQTTATPRDPASGQLWGKLRTETRETRSAPGSDVATMSQGTVLAMTRH